MVDGNTKYKQNRQKMKGASTQVYGGDFNFSAQKLLVRRNEY